MKNNHPTNPFPLEILNKLAVIFETARERRDLTALMDGIQFADAIDISQFNNKEKCRLYFFIANAWSYILQLKYDSPEVIPLSSAEYENEIYNLRLARSFIKDAEAMLACQVLTNLGCAFSHVGRFVEAQHYFNEALMINPEFGMALGNKGYGLFRYARELYDDSHQFIFLQYAHKCLIGACKDTDVYAEARDFFLALANHIASIYPLDSLNDFKQYPDILSKAHKDEIDYRLWCIDNILFLNPLNDVIQQNIVARDILHTPTVTLKKGEKPIHLSLYNQIKQEYVSARYFFYDGAYKDIPHYSDREVSLYRVFDMPVYSINVEKVKIAFRMCYSIFDKIAYLLNIYLNLGLSNNRVSFRNIWHENGLLKNPIRTDILRNRALQGLFWLSKDLDEKEESPIEPDAKKIATIRNYIEHKSFKVVELKNNGNNEFPETFEIEQDDFYDKTLRLLKLTRSALIYLSAAIYEEESGKDRVKGITIPVDLDLLNHD